MTARLWRCRLALWLYAMDAVALCGGFGSRLYLWLVGRASDVEYEVEE